MKKTFDDGRCQIIKFDEEPEELIKNGWLGDEDFARIFWASKNVREIRIFKKSGESYVLSNSSNDSMVKYKIDQILSIL